MVSDSVPKAIKITIYDPDDNSEEGMMVIVNERLWRKTQNEKAAQNAGKKKKKYMAVLPIQENYHIGEILKKCGFKILMESVSIKEKSGLKFEVFSKSFLKEKTYLDSLENIVTIKAILDFYKNNDPETF